MDVADRCACSRGFSVIELMAVLAVAVILISLGVPAWKDLVSGSKVSSSRMLLAGTLALARETAVEHGQYLTLCPSADQQQCSGDYTAWDQGMILFVDRNADRQHSAGETIVRAIGRIQRISIQSSSGRRSIRYSADGSAWGSNLTLRFCVPENASHNRAIILYGSGRARFSDTLSNGDPVTCI
jgi:type IV fimbrial biogenesis protein FimT